MQGEYIDDNYKTYNRNEGYIDQLTRLPYHMCCSCVETLIGLTNGANVFASTIHKAAY